jgi:hypothetical protein
MIDVVDIIKNINNIYESNTSLTILKDFERVIDELDLYVYSNWKTGELVEGPVVDRHWVKCSFMWPENEMPDPMGAKRLLDYDCKIRMGKSSIVQPRAIRSEDDIRPGTKKGKLDRNPIWVVEIMMPKKLIMDMYTGYKTQIETQLQAATTVAMPDLETPEVEQEAAAPAPEAAAGAPA